jgi:hypothetical protein
MTTPSDPVAAGTAADQATGQAAAANLDPGSAGPASTDFYMRLAGGYINGEPEMTVPLGTK